MSFLRIYLVIQIFPQVFLNDLFNQLFIFFLLVKLWILNYCLSSRIFVITRYKLMVRVCILEILKVLWSLNFHFNHVITCLSVSTTILRINVDVCLFWFVNDLLWETLDRWEARSHHRCCLLAWASKHVYCFYRNHSSCSRRNYCWLEFIWRSHYLNEGRFILINLLIV